MLHGDASVLSVAAVELASHAAHHACYFVAVAKLSARRLLDLSHRLDADDAGKFDAARKPLPREQFRSVQSKCAHANEHLAWLRRRDRALLDLENFWSAPRIHHCGFHRAHGNPRRLVCLRLTCFAGWSWKNCSGQF